MPRSLVALTAAVLLAAGTWHLSLVNSFPGKDEVVNAPLSKVALTFSAPVNIKLSAVSILGQDSSEVAKLAVTVGAKPTMVDGKLARPLPAGRYLVRWRTAGADGHAIRGTHAFTVNPVE